MLPGDSKEMNKKIKNLWDTALEEFSKEHQFATIMLPEPLKEKFARLIVRECADFADEHNDYSEGVTLGVGRALKKHFGVEE